MDWQEYGQIEYILSKSVSTLREKCDYRNTTINEISIRSAIFALLIDNKVQILHHDDNGGAT